MLCGTDQLRRAITREHFAITVTNELLDGLSTSSPSLAGLTLDPEEISEMVH